MRIDRYEAFALELTERRPHGRSAYRELLGNRVEIDALARAEHAVEDSLLENRVHHAFRRGWTAGEGSDHGIFLL
jgi:hypothetical protein